MLKSDLSGVAFAHLTLPADAYAREVAAIESALETLGAVAGKPHVSYLTGQSDVMLQLRLSDFRAAFRLGYESEATGANWLFAVPYVDTEAGDILSPGLTLNYVLHVRLNRNVYRAGAAQAEELVVDAISAAVKGRVSAQVLAGFGWSDLIVTGCFADSDDLRRFVRRVEHMSIEGLPNPIVRRVLTLISYDIEPDPSDQSEMTVRPIIFGRALPTHVRQAARAIGSHNVGEWDTFSLDGKWDIVSLPKASEPAIPVHRFIELHRQLAIVGTPLKSHGIERLETHLLSHEATSAEFDDEESPRLPAACGCRGAFSRSLDFRLLDECERRLPKAVSVAIHNVMNLFQAALRDPINCCDISLSIRSCEKSLTRLLRKYLDLSARFDQVSAIDTFDQSKRVSFRYPFVVRARQDIADWCTYAERVVSQRTVGRFEEFLAQDERVVSYRGGIQKLLFLTDALLNSYASRVLPSGETPTFMSLFDPIDIVNAMRIGGFVRVPVRYLFVLPLTINHLWHEVGVFRFYLKYDQPFDSRTRKRLQESARRLEASPRDKNIDLMVDVTDCYGDAFTLMHGFGGDVHRFILSLATAYFEMSDFRFAPPSQRLRYMVHLLTRLYVAIEFRQTVEEIRQKMHDFPLTFARDQIDDSAAPHDEVILNTLQVIVSVLQSELLDFPRYRDVEITDEVVVRALRNVDRCIDAVHRAYLNELAFELALHRLPAPPDVTKEFEQIKEGGIVTIATGGAIDALFLRMQHDMIDSLRRKKKGSLGDVLSSESFFRSISSLIRSSILSFYQQGTWSEKESGARDSDVPVQPLMNLWQAMPPRGGIPDVSLEY